MKKLFFATIATFVTAIALTATPVSADTVCTQNYGGGQTCNSFTLTINKTVQNPNGGNFVDNLGVNDSKYAPGSVIPFQVTVTNTGNQTLNNVVITDFLPQFLSYDSGDGTTINVGDLGAGQSKTYNIKARVAGESSITAGVTCVTNTSTVTSNQTGQQTDTAQVCIQKNVQGTSTFQVVQPSAPITTIPATGPEVTTMLGLLAAGITGLVIRKKA